MPALALRLVLSGLLLTLTAIPASAQQPVPRYGFRITGTYPHDIEAFTQGLFYHEGFLYEGTGKRGSSRLSKRKLEEISVLQARALPPRYFGEGIERLGDRIFQLTWTSHMVFEYELDSFEQVTTHYNSSEGWGLTSDGELLILSDGSHVLQFINPDRFVAERKLAVTLNGNPVNNLNELEYINGEIWANVWQTDYILRIDPQSGEVNSIVDLTGLADQTMLGSAEAVLNGIAWDSEQERLFVTGKHWSHLFEIELISP